MKYLGFILICCSLTTIYSQNNNNNNAPTFTSNLKNEFTLKDSTSHEYQLAKAIINRETKKAWQLVKLPTLDPNYCIDISTIKTPFKDRFVPLLALALLYYNDDARIIATLVDKGANCRAPVQPVNCDHAITIAAFSLQCSQIQRKNQVPYLPELVVDYLAEKDPALKNAPY